MKTADGVEVRHLDRAWLVETSGHVVETTIIVPVPRFSSRCTSTDTPAFKDCFSSKEAALAFVRSKLCPVCSRTACRCRLVTPSSQLSVGQTVTLEELASGERSKGVLVELIGDDMEGTWWKVYSNSRVLHCVLCDSRGDRSKRMEHFRRFPQALRGCSHGIIAA